MIRCLTIAAVATLIAAPASARSIKVDLTGKSTAEVHADIARAAKRVCAAAVAGATFRREAYDACFKETVAQTHAQLAAAMSRASQVASK